MNLPNKITTVRVLLIPVFVVLMLMQDKIPYGNFIALFVFATACITDALDGHIARKYNLVTDFGKFMDPLADKLLVCAALICFVESGLMPSYVVIIIISREFIISGFRLIAVEKGLVIAASKVAKVKTTFQMIMCILFIINLDITAVNYIEQIVMWIAVALTVISLIEYLYKNKSVISKDNI